MSEVKRYGFRIGMPERGNVETILSVEDHIGEYVKYEDYEKLKAQLEKAETALTKLQDKANKTEIWVENNMFENDEGDGDFYVKSIAPFSELEMMRELALEYFKEKEKK